MHHLARHSLRLLLCLAIGLAIQLQAATAKDIQGEWVIDGPATWAQMKASPQLAGAPPEQLQMMETMFLGEMGKMSSVVTADTITQTGPDGASKTMPYKITKIDGDTVTTETTGDDGTPEVTTILVKGETLHLGSPKQPGMVMVLKRKAASVK